MGVAGFGLPAAAWSTNSYSSPRSLAEPELLHILGSRARVRDIGASYRAAVPREDDVEILRNTITAGLGVPEPASESALGAHLKRQVGGDFAAGRTVVVNGWVLSVTEARQCALYSLLYS